MVIRELLTKTIEDFRKNDIENEIFEANLIIRTVLKLSPIELVLAYQEKVGEKDLKTISDMVKRRINKEPLQYILGTQEFMGLEFLVSPDVLIPRQDTETLVEAVVGKNKGVIVLDICTGSGCIAISIAHYNKNAFVRALDISDEALKLAKRNAEKLGVSDRVRFEKCDILKEVPSGIFDCIVSNPPYIETDEIKKLQKEVKNHEPAIALDGGLDGLDFYKRIAEISPKLLQKGGSLYLEVGINQANDVSKLLENDFCNIEIIKDLCGAERVVFAKLKN